jgi:phosphomannomutase
VLPILDMAANRTISDLVNQLPKIYTASNWIKNFEREGSLAIIISGLAMPKQLLVQFGLANSELLHIDTTYGLRLFWGNGEVVHLRPSGNTSMLRWYAEAISSLRPKKIVGSSLKALLNGEAG